MVGFYPIGGILSTFSLIVSVFGLICYYHPGVNRFCRLSFIFDLRSDPLQELMGASPKLEGRMVVAKGGVDIVLFS